MGEAKTLIQADTTPSALKLAGELIDTIDKAIEAKQHDLVVEPQRFPENSWKLGILTSAQDLVRRARAILEDYASPPKASKAPPKCSAAWLTEGVQLQDDAHIWDVTLVTRNGEGEVIGVALETEWHGRNMTLTWDEATIDNFFDTYSEDNVR